MLSEKEVQEKANEVKIDLGYTYRIYVKWEGKFHPLSGGGTICRNLIYACMFTKKEVHKALRALEKSNPELTFEKRKV